jgi:hypothetical protein
MAEGLGIPKLTWEDSLVLQLGPQGLDSLKDEVVVA